MVVERGAFQRSVLTLKQIIFIILGKQSLSYPYHFFCKWYQGREKQDLSPSTRFSYYTIYTLLFLWGSLEAGIKKVYNVCLLPLQNLSSLRKEANIAFLYSSRLILLYFIRFVSDFTNQSTNVSYFSNHLLR